MSKVDNVQHLLRPLAEELKELDSRRENAGHDPAHGERDRAMSEAFELVSAALSEALDGMTDEGTWALADFRKEVAQRLSDTVEHRVKR